MWSNVFSPCTLVPIFFFLFLDSFQTNRVSSLFNDEFFLPFLFLVRFRIRMGRLEERHPKHARSSRWNYLRVRLFEKLHCHTLAHEQLLHQRCAGTLNFRIFTGNYKSFVLTFSWDTFIPICVYLFCCEEILLYSMFPVPVIKSKYSNIHYDIYDDRSMHNSQ